MELKKVVDRYLNGEQIQLCSKGENTWHDLGKKKPITYAIINYNHEEFRKESTLLHNKYRKTKKYAFICIQCNEDNTESISFIEYSNDLKELQVKANGFKTYFNYPNGFYKHSDGNIYLLP